MLIKRSILVGSNFCPLMTQYACAVTKKPFLQRQERESGLFGARSMPVDDTETLEVVWSFEKV